MDRDTITFFEAFGCEEEFKWLFGELMNISTFSRERVSNILRNELVYDFTKSINAVFTFYISLDDLDIQYQ